MSEVVSWKRLLHPYYMHRLSPHPWVGKMSPKGHIYVNGYLQHRPVLWLISLSLHVSIPNIRHEMQWL
jgi:hypothetical protein